MRRSSLLMLAAAIILGLGAVFLARIFLVTSAKPPVVAQALTTVPAVVAAQPIAFGQKVTADKLKIVQWPAEGIPPGTFQRIPDAIGTEDRVALRAIDANELITDKALSGKESRLSASPLLEPTMRAVSVPIGEASGTGGFIVAGDRVDVYLTRPGEDDNLPYTDQLMQDVRVLAVGQDKNLGKDKPEIVKTATIAVTPVQAQRIALAQTVGTLSLSLRSLTDESKTRLETAQILDLNDGTTTRVLRKPKKAADTPPPPGEALPKGPTIDIYRGTGKPTIYPVPSGS